MVLDRTKWTVLDDHKILDKNLSRIPGLKNVSEIQEILVIEDWILIDREAIVAEGLLRPSHRHKPGWRLNS